MSIAREIQRLRVSHAHAKQGDRQFMQSSPLERAKEKVSSQLEREFGDRLQLLRSIAAFASLSNEILLEAVHVLEEVMFQRRDVIIREGDSSLAAYLRLLSLSSRARG